MLVPSNRIFYAIEAMMYIAYNGQARAINSRDMAERQQLPSRYLEPILQKMVRADLLKSVRGPQGGYVLGRERRRISLGDIARVLYKDEDILPKAATPLGELVLKPALTQLQQQWNTQLESLTLADLCAQAMAAKLAPDTQQNNDFTI